MNRSVLALLAAATATICTVAAFSVTAADPDYKAAVACSSKVSSLADSVKKLLADTQNIDRKCNKDTKYYKDMIGLKKQSSVHLKTMIKGHDTNKELETQYKSDYTTMMCMKTYEAFVGEKEQKKRIEMLHLCMGRTSLAPKSLLHHKSEVIQGAATVADIKDCPAAVSMQEKVTMLQSTKAAKVAECKARKAELKQDMDKVDKKEEGLENDVYGHHDDKGEIRSKVGLEVTKKFCDVITPNYKLNEAKIVDFWTKNCPA